MSVPFAFDFTINIGNLAALVAILGVGWKVIAAVNAMAFKVDLMWRVFEQKIERRGRLEINGREEH